MLPVLVMEPVYVSKPPGTAATPGQFWTMDRPGVVVMAQVAVAVLVVVPPQVPAPVTVTMLVEEQLVGAR